MSAELGAELEAGSAEWIREHVAFLELLLEEEYPDTGHLGRALRRECLMIQRSRGLSLLRGEAPETNAADVLREAVVWYELRQESGADEPDSEVPPWVTWAWRLLPTCGLSRWAKLTLRDSEVKESEELEAAAFPDRHNGDAPERRT